MRTRQNYPFEMKEMNDLFWAVADALHLPQIVEWLAARLK
jgi:hypothetical protein